MPSLAIFVSHTGKTLQLSCAATTRVDAVQQALVALTGVPLADQIVMCEGSRLDPHKALSAYGLPVDEHDQPHDVFLYNRALLKPGALAPVDEAAPAIAPQVPPQLTARDQPHSLDRASSPLLRALPEYKRHFQYHVGQAKALAEAALLRYAACTQLVGEQEVQALSIDAARANVEAHFSYICAAFEGFMQRYLQQHSIHADVLAAFEEDLQFLTSTEVHAALRRDGCQRLIDLVNAQQLREAWGSCHRSHRHFATKVSELESLFSLLKGDVESLFMQAPSVDLEALNERLAEMHSHVNEQASIVQALSSDYVKVQQIVEQTTAQLGAAASASITMQLSDTCQMLEIMHESHVGHLLPRVMACDATLGAFTAQCVGCKNALTKDVQQQLQCIASQQSRIRELKDKLAVFGEALGKQDEVVGELLVMRRVAAAYKQCLAECVRRAAFAEKYAQSAAKLAESMGRFRDKEVSTRDAFRRHVEKYISSSLLERMGLLEQPPHCQVSLPSSAGEQLMHVTVDEMRRFQLPWSGISLNEPSVKPLSPSYKQQQPQSPQEVGAAEAPGGEGDGPGGSFEDLTTSLQIENATLRAELAASVAMECIRAAQLPPLPRQQLPPQQDALAGITAMASTVRTGTDKPQTVQLAAEVAAQQPQQLPTGAVQKFEKALTAKDGLIGELEGRLAKAKSLATTYEQRILKLEAQLSTLATTSACTEKEGAAQHEVANPFEGAQQGQREEQAARPEVESATHTLAVVVPPFSGGAGPAAEPAVLTQQGARAGQTDTEAVGEGQHARSVIAVGSTAGRARPSARLQSAGSCDSIIAVPSPVAQVSPPAAGGSAAVSAGGSQRHPSHSSIAEGSLVESPSIGSAIAAWQTEEQKEGCPGDLNLSEGSPSHPTPGGSPSSLSSSPAIPKHAGVQVFAESLSASQGMAGSSSLLGTLGVSTVSGEALSYSASPSSVGGPSPRPVMGDFGGAASSLVESPRKHDGVIEGTAVAEQPWVHPALEASPPVITAAVAAMAPLSQPETVTIASELQLRQQQQEEQQKGFGPHLKQAPTSEEREADVAAATQKDAQPHAADRVEPRQEEQHFVMQGEGQAAPAEYEDETEVAAEGPESEVPVHDSAVTQQAEGVKTGVDAWAVQSASETVASQSTSEAVVSLPGGMLIAHSPVVLPLDEGSDVEGIEVVSSEEEEEGGTHGLPLKRLNQPT